jgi:Transient receptor potential (TRP) ion channel/ML-like domain
LAVPSGTFAATGSQAIPSQYADMVPAIAFTVPDLDGMAQLQLMSKNGGAEIACIQSDVGNGKSFSTPAVPAIAAGIAGGALLVSGFSALASGGHPGTTASSPTFFDVMGWFQSMALNGMLSVSYPQVYRSFSKNFAFSGLLIPWQGMQMSIDNFRQSTGGNLTDSSVEVLQNSTLVYQGSNNTMTVAKRSLTMLKLFIREATTTTTTTTSAQTSNNNTKVMRDVHGIEAFVEPLMIPKENTFMTVLLVFAIVIAAIMVGILLFKVILEAWAVFGRFPKKLLGFRERYWWIMAKSITSVILLLYGMWTLYCVYQFTQGDSWAAKALAGVTLALFTAVLFWFSWRIASLARKYKKADGDVSALYNNKETWRNYAIFYENYKQSYWWLFIPVIVYMFARGVVIAAGDGHGLIQTGGQLIIESFMLIMLLFLRPYSLKSGNWISIVIQVVRVLSVLCILVFVEQLGISAAPKAITGVVLVAMQAGLTGLLAILIAVNGLITFCKANPHRKARKEAGKFLLQMRYLFHTHIE